MKIPVCVIFILYTKHCILVHGIFGTSVSFFFEIGESIDLTVEYFKQK